MDEQLMAAIAALTGETEAAKQTLALVNTKARLDATETSLGSLSAELTIAHARAASAEKKLEDQ